ncbi:unnamed protein product, partial [marine sediment metagenome]
MNKAPQVPSRIKHWFGYITPAVRLSDAASEQPAIIGIPS